jgi:hypothetical protein
VLSLGVTRTLLPGQGNCSSFRLPDLTLILLQLWTSHKVWVLQRVGHYHTSAVHLLRVRWTGGCANAGCNIHYVAGDLFQRKLCIKLKPGTPTFFFLATSFSQSLSSMLRILFSKPERIQWHDPLSCGVTKSISVARVELLASHLYKAVVRTYSVLLWEVSQMTVRLLSYRFCITITCEMCKMRNPVLLFYSSMS